MKDWLFGAKRASAGLLLALFCAQVAAQTPLEAPPASLDKLPEATPEAASSSQASVSFPALMSLTQALTLADSGHPQILMQRAQLQAQRAEKMNVGLDKRWGADLSIGARTADLVNDDDGFKNDSLANLTISKLLWDFGQSATENEVAALGAQGAEISLQYAERLQRIDIMRQFFSVLSADYQYAADNEAMTLAFFPFNRAQERNERFDSVSEVEVLEKRATYLAELTARNQSIRRQRANRFHLALAMGHPRALPDGLIDPDLSAYARDLPDFDELLEKVLAQNPLIKQAQVELAQLEATRGLLGSSEKPEVNLRLSATAYEQDYRKRDRSRALISLNVPLFTGKLQDAEKAGLAAQLAEKQAHILSLDYEVREQVLAWVQHLEALNQDIKQNQQNLDYTERALDKARLLYEMEVRAQIGRAQADMAKLLWQDAEAKYQRALIWEQIDAVLGAPLVEFE